MAERKQSSRKSSYLRLALIFALNAAAVFALWRIWPGGTSAPSAGSVQAASAPRVVEELPQGPPPLAPQARHKLERDLRAIVSEWVERARKESKNKVHQGNAAVALHVREVGWGAVGEIALGSDRLLRPASNLKLITTAAALVLLGPDGAFRTRFDVGGPIVLGVLHGNLVVRAGADPLFDSATNGDIEPLLAPALDQIVAGGLHLISGDLVLDELTYQVPAAAPAWPDAGQHWAEYCALAGGFSANRGCLSVVVSPGAVGGPARVALFPREHGLAVNLGVRTEAKGKLDVQCSAKASGVLVRGSIPAANEAFVASFSHPDPVELFGHALGGALARRGIVVQGRLRRERNAPAQATIAQLETPIERMLAPINADSTNAAADQLFLATAFAVTGQGTRAAGAQATELALKRLGISTEGLVQVDGSGLSRANQVTARQVVALVEKVLTQDGRSARMFLDSLAIAGERGTLDDRMTTGPARGRVRAKTGFIAGTSALSGVAETVEGRRFAFSILVNYPDVGGLNSSVWKPMQDALCERLVETRQ
ncbi:MAG: D-alanyl-D-alanine carboxypeptidase/D-alanyl-D-alanine-endopeptidase [Planctomycetes bacterium]|nr:D-alanyl-D-alanine carboxypeptidase/D-alanyl-D-alanine-endopeptidase [Planctomycetota bacterium]